MELDSLRKQLLDCNGHALVLGGPGSGKTTIALKKSMQRIDAGLKPGQSVLFLSFSRAAVVRIMEASKTEMKRDQRALLEVQTFHSFFWSLLRSHSYLLGAPRCVKILMPQDERALSRGIKPNKNKKEWMAWLLERERLFYEDGRIAFDLFAPNAVTLLQKSRHIRRILAQRHPLIIVDEAQDTGPNAWEAIRLIAPATQIICLADLEQQIFDYLPGVGPERIEEIRSSLTPFEMTLGTQNHRSANSEIVHFANDILRGTPRGKSYKGVSRLGYDGKNRDLTKTLRMALGILHNKIRKETGKWGRSIAILAPSGASAARISSALQSTLKPIKHKFFFDEAEVLLSARFAAYLLEPKTRGMENNDDLIYALELLTDIERARGSKKVEQIQKWALTLRSGKTVKARFVIALKHVINKMKEISLTGDPGRDWISVKRFLRDTQDLEMIEIAKNLDYLIAFNRGARIGLNLANDWLRDGQYTHAREALDQALFQEQLLDNVDDRAGLQVMTIHKSKGKQFDGVIVMRGQFHNGNGYVSNFVWRDDPPPHYRSRKILRVAITRAKVHTMILEPGWPECPILLGHKL